MRLPEAPQVSGLCMSPIQDATVVAQAFMLSNVFDRRPFTCEPVHSDLQNKRSPLIIMFASLFSQRSSDEHDEGPSMFARSYSRMMQGMPVDSPQTERNSSFHLRGSYSKQALSDELRPSSAPPGMSASPADLTSTSPSPVFVSVTEAMDELTKRYMLNVSEYDHVEWLLKSGLLPLNNLFDVCDHLGYPRHSTELTQPEPLPAPAPANVTGLSPSAPPPGISPFQSPPRQGTTDYFRIDTVDRPAGPCALPHSWPT